MFLVKFFGITCGVVSFIFLPFHLLFNEVLLLRLIPLLLDGNTWIILPVIGFVKPPRILCMTKIHNCILTVDCRGLRPTLRVNRDHPYVLTVR